MKKIIFRTIGLIALMFGVYTLSNTVSSIFHSSESMNLLVQISKLTLTWAAIYGGYQALLGRELGRRMLIAWLSYQFLMMVFIAITVIYNFATSPQNNFRPTISSPNLVIGFYIVCVAAFIFLAWVRLDDDLVASNSHQIHIVGKILAVLSPGFGRMLVGNKIAGLLLFGVYLVLATGTISSSNFETQNLVINSVYKLIVWSTFVKYDWYVVQNYGKPEQEELPLVPKLNSSDVNGG
jgi:drug/metabolite transporter (DMT)-like permease